MQELTTRIGNAREGSALPVVMAFVLLLFITAGVSAFQTSGIRRTHNQSYIGFQATEAALSAIDEVAAQLSPEVEGETSTRAALERLLPTGTFGTAEEFLASIRDNQVPRGVNASDVEYRTITYSSGKVEKLLTALSFPRAPMTVPTASLKSREFYSKQFGLRKMSDVTVTMLRFRREHYLNAPRWVNWGVVQMRCTAEVSRGLQTAYRDVKVDRLFKFRAWLDAGTSNTFWALHISQLNQRIAVTGSRTPGGQP